jgi:hypothetical protein
MKYGRTHPGLVVLGESGGANCACLRSSSSLHGTFRLASGFDGQRAGLACTEVSPCQLAITITQQRTTTTVTLQGEWDIAEAPTMRQALRDLLERSPECLVDERALARDQGLIESRSLLSTSPQFGVTCSYG